MFLGVELLDAGGGGLEFLFGGGEFLLEFFQGLLVLFQRGGGFCHSVFCDAGLILSSGETAECSVKILLSAGQFFFPRAEAFFGVGKLGAEVLQSLRGGLVLGADLLEQAACVLTLGDEAGEGGGERYDFGVDGG